MSRKEGLLLVHRELSRSSRKSKRARRSQNASLAVRSICLERWPLGKRLNGRGLQHQ